MEQRYKQNPERQIEEVKSKYEKKIDLLEKRIDMKVGYFEKLAPEFESIHLISQIQEDRIKEEFKKESLTSLHFYCGDGVTYGLKGQEVFLYLTDFVNNPLIKYPEKTAQELTRNYKELENKNFDSDFFIEPSIAADLEVRASSSNGVVAFNLSDLPIYTHMPYYESDIGCVRVSTLKLAYGREAFRAEYGDKVTALFDRVHGAAIYGLNGIANLVNEDNISGYSVFTTDIGILHKRFVQKILEQKEKGTMIARLPYLHPVHEWSNVSLSFKCVNTHGFVRGVVKKPQIKESTQGEK